MSVIVNVNGKLETVALQPGQGLILTKDGYDIIDNFEPIKNQLKKLIAITHLNTMIQYIVNNTDLKVYGDSNTTHVSLWGRLYHFHVQYHPRITNEVIIGMFHKMTILEPESKDGNVHKYTRMSFDYEETPTVI